MRGEGRRTVQEGVRERRLRRGGGAGGRDGGRWW